MLATTKTNKNHRWTKLNNPKAMTRPGIAACLVLASWCAVAQSVPTRGVDGSLKASQTVVPKQSVGVQLGANSNYKKAMLSYEPPRLWSHQLSGAGRLDLDVELGLAYWTSRRRAPKSLWQVSAIPFLRWWPKESLYIEVGAGPTLLSRTRFAGRELSTRFQFGSHVGAGVLFHDTHRIGLRYSHYSNANIKKPNQGLGALQLTYSHLF